MRKRGKQDEYSYPEVFLHLILKLCLVPRVPLAGRLWWVWWFQKKKKKRGTITKNGSHRKLQTKIRDEEPKERRKKTSCKKDGSRKVGIRFSGFPDGGDQGAVLPWQAINLNSSLPLTLTLSPSLSLSIFMSSIWTKPISFKQAPFPLLPLGSSRVFDDTSAWQTKLHFAQGVTRSEWQVPCQAFINRVTSKNALREMGRNGKLNKLSICLQKKN